jgi:hypothetical protein
MMGLASLRQSPLVRDGPEDVLKMLEDFRWRLRLIAVGHLSTFVWARLLARRLGGLLNIKLLIEVQRQCAQPQKHAPTGKGLRLLEAGRAGN